MRTIFLVLVALSVCVAPALASDTGDDASSRIKCLLSSQEHTDKELAAIQHYVKEAAGDSTVNKAIEKYRSALQAAKENNKSRVAALQAKNFDRDNQLQEQEKNLSSELEKSRQSLQYLKSAMWAKKEAEKLDTSYGELEGQSASAREAYKKALSDLSGIYTEMAKDPVSSCNMPPEIKAKVDAAQVAKSEAEADFRFEKEAAYIRSDAEQKYADYPEVTEAAQLLVADLDIYYSAGKRIAAGRIALEKAKRSAMEQRKVKEEQECAKKASSKHTSSVKSCAACGNKSSESDKFCRSCGAGLGKK